LFAACAAMRMMSPDIFCAITPQVLAWTGAATRIDALVAVEFLVPRVLGPKRPVGADGCS